MSGGLNIKKNEVILQRNNYFTDVSYEASIDRERLLREPLLQHLDTLKDWFKSCFDLSSIVHQSL